MISTGRTQRWHVLSPELLLGLSLQPPGPTFLGQGLPLTVCLQGGATGIMDRTIHCAGLSYSLQEG